MKFFSGSKASRKSASTSSVDESDIPQSPNAAPSSSSSSPTKKPARPVSHHHKDTTKASSTSKSSRLSRHSTDAGHSRRSSKYDPDTHPLNLPPEERERKRLSAMSNSAMNSNSMDVDPQPVNGAASPPPPPAKGSSNASAQKNFAVPITNGSMAPNGNDEAPAPPPHKSNPSSPVPSPLEEAESYKTAGNRLFKEKNYAKAIEQYSKGMRQYMMTLFTLITYIHRRPLTCLLRVLLLLFCH